MYKDSKGYNIRVGDVVVSSVGNLYTVSGFDSTMQCSVQLSNGCVRTQSQPQELTCVDSVQDLKGLGLF